MDGCESEMGDRLFLPRLMEISSRVRCWIIDVVPTNSPPIKFSVPQKSKGSVPCRVQSVGLHATVNSKSQIQSNSNAGLTPRKFHKSWRLDSRSQLQASWQPRNATEKPLLTPPISHRRTRQTYGLNFVQTIAQFVILSHEH